MSIGILTYLELNIFIFIYLYLPFTTKIQVDYAGIKGGCSVLINEFLNNKCF